LVNLYRWLADLPAVTTSSTKDQGAQDCALVLDSLGYISHYPPSTAPCYSTIVADIAAQSNISPYQGVYSVDLYMSDPGNETTMGHRRWILSNSLDVIGLGSTDEFSCMTVLGGNGNAGAQWTAWPPPGFVPAEVFEVSWANTNDTGFTVQSNNINLSSATISVKMDGSQPMPVDVVQLGQYYGSDWAINFIPNGWVATAGHSYTIQVGGVANPFEYTFEVVDCQ
jgi:hypothetical protein